MTENTLTPQELRRRIAEMLGYTVEAYTSKWGASVWCVRNPDGSVFVDGIVRDDPPDLGALSPDWPGDVGEALALCRDICLSRQWRLIVDYIALPDRVAVYAEFQTQLGFTAYYARSSKDDNEKTADATTLARLAVGALTGTQEGSNA